MNPLQILGYLLGKHTPSGTTSAVPFHRPGRPQATAPQLPLGAVADSSKAPRFVPLYGLGVNPRYVLDVDGTFVPRWHSPWFVSGLSQALDPGNVEWDWPA